MCISKKKKSINPLNTSIKSFSYVTISSIIF